MKRMFSLSPTCVRSTQFRLDVASFVFKPVGVTLNTDYNLFHIGPVVLFFVTLVSETSGGKSFMKLKGEQVFRYSM